MGKDIKMNEIELLLEYDEESLWDYYEPTNRERRQTNNRNIMVVQGRKLFNLERLQRERAQRIKQGMV